MNLNLKNLIMNKPILTLANGTTFIKNKKGLGIREKPSRWTIAINRSMPVFCFAYCFAEGLPIIGSILLSIFVGFLGYGILNQSGLFLNTNLKRVHGRQVFWFVPFNQIKMGRTADGDVLVYKEHFDEKVSFLYVIDCSSEDEQNKVMEILYKYLN